MQIVFGTGIEVVAAAPAKATAVMRDPLNVFPAARRARLPGVRAGGPAAAAFAAAAAASLAAAAVIGGAGGVGGAAGAGAAGGAAAGAGAAGAEGAAGAAGGAAIVAAAASAPSRPFSRGAAVAAAAARPVIGAAGGAPSLRPAGFFGAAGALAVGALAADALLFDFFFFDFFFFLGVVELTTGSGSTPPRRLAAAARPRARRGVHLASASAIKHASTRAQVACLILAKQRAGEDCLLFVCCKLHVASGM